MVLDYSSLQQKPNRDVIAFLETSSIRKIAISQQSKVCEIFLACQQLPAPDLYVQCLHFFAQNMTQASGVRLIVQPLGRMDTDTFLTSHYELFVTMLQQQHPTVAGWLYNSYWKMNAEEEELTICIGQEIGLRFLHNMQFTLQASVLLDEMLQEKYQIRLQHDAAIKPPEIKKQEIPVQASSVSSAAPVSKPADKPAASLADELVLLGKLIKDTPRAIDSFEEEEKFVTVEGRIFGMDVRELKNGKQLLTFKITDDRDSILCKVIKEADEIKELKGKLKKVKALKVKGSIREDSFARELTMMAFDLNLTKPKKRSDNAADKRVELHLHTNMSANDALSDVGDLIQLAADMGHEAIAITDHGVVQSFPEAYHAGQAAGVKIIYGVEGYLFDDDLPKEEQKTYHCIILAKNKAGLKALYQLVTESNLNFFYRRPRMPKRLVAAVRENLVIGSACEAGELIQTYIKTNKDHDALVKIASFYDFLEVQPHMNNEFMLRKGMFRSEDELKQINLDIYALGQELGKPVVATGDVHFANKDDSIYRAILMAGKKFEDADQQAPLYYRNTEEMLAEFDYFPPDAAKEIVIINPKKIIADFEELKPVPDGLHSPVIEGAEDEIRNLTYTKAHELYGPELPELVQARINKELDSIIGNGFSVLYLIAHKLVKKSNDDGYLVGSRGSVGSSFVANMTGITEVNSLPPHYRCPNCYHTVFKDDGTYSAGADMPDAVCEKCGTPMIKDGHDIPFETFLGFKGDKVPDIDLNFSGVYQPRAHAYTEELFGKDNVFRAGTFQTFAEKTAQGYVVNYLNERNMKRRQAEIERLALGFTGVRRTTGQHPGGLMVIPKGIDVHDFTPLQIPADDPNKGTVTTHFTYEQIHDRLVKLDILGHDNPTIIRMLEDLTGCSYQDIPLDEPKTLSLFSSTDALGVTPEQIGSEVGTYGIPEFGTKFTRQMLVDVQPKSFSELVRISGFSHGTDVWLGNAQDLILSGTATASEVIGCRDDIMIYLIHMGLEPIRAFKIMEGVRKGKGLKPDEEEYMREKHVPEWYIKSCKTVKYLFPKAHAVAYVMMAFRIAWFKVYHPLAFYAAAFTVRTDDFDADVICKGLPEIENQMKNIKAMGNDATEKDKKFQIILELCLEMYQRGYSCERVNLMESDAENFRIVDGRLIPPFCALQGLGQSVACSIVEAREQAPFTSIEDLSNRGKAGKSIIETLQNHGVLNGLPETDQLQLF